MRLFVTISHLRLMHEERDLIAAVALDTGRIATARGASHRNAVGFLLDF
jgi:hypothetical protein